MERVGAVQMERMGFSKVVPELLDLNSAVRLSGGAEEPDHLAESHQATILCFSGGLKLRDDAAYDLLEERCVGQSVEGDLGESFCGVQRDKATLADGKGEI